MACEECGNEEATLWAYDQALCTECAETLSELDKATQP